MFAPRSPSDAALHGPGGKKGNKLLSFEQFEFALNGVAKELGEELEHIKVQAASARPSVVATKTVSTRFHDDASAYTGSHKLVHSATEAPLPRALAGATPQTPEPPRSAPARGAQRSALRPQSAPPRPPAARSQGAGRQGRLTSAVGLLLERPPDPLQGGLLEPPKPPTFSIRNAEFFHSRGVGAAARGDLQGAIEDYDKALSMGADAPLRVGVDAPPPSRSFKAHLSRALLLDRSGLHGQVSADPSPSPLTTHLSPSPPASPSSSSPPSSSYPPSAPPSSILHAQAVLDYSGALSALQQDAEATLEVEDASEAQQQQQQLQQQLELQPHVSTGELLGRHQQQLLQQQQLQPQGRLPAKAVVLFNRGSSLHRQGQHRAAVEDLDEALSLAPLRADFYENRAPAWSRSSSLAAAELATHLPARGALALALA